MRFTCNDLLAALCHTPALTLAIWIAFWLRHGETILHSLGMW